MSTVTTTPTVRRDLRGHRAATHAFAWTAVFVVWRGYWALGGDFGFGDQQSGIPDTTSSLAGWAFSTIVAGMFVAGLAVPLALARDVGPRRLLVGLMWAGAAVLAVRGIVGLMDDGLRFSGLQETGLSGLSDRDVLGTAQPSAYTIWSTIGMDAFFAAGGLLFACAARRASTSDAARREHGAGANRLHRIKRQHLPLVAKIAALGIVEAAVARRHVRDRGRRHRWPTVLARAGGVVLLIGAAVSLGRWPAQGGLGDDDVAGIAITASFLLGGILFSRLGWRDT